MIHKIGKYLPAIERPTYKPSFNTRLMWTGVALICYLVLSHITVYGIQKTPQIETLITIQTLLGARFGSLMTLGIGPIVTAGIILQLLVGSKIIDWDTTKPEDRKKFQTWNKFLAVLFCFLEAIAFVLAGSFPIQGGIITIIFVILQLAAGGIIVLLLDELISKWGFGSGISLFIAAGVATQIVIGALSFLSLPTPTLTNPGPFVGLLWNFIYHILSNNTYLALVCFIPLLATAIIFILVVYVQGISIDIPLTFTALRGFGRSWSLKLLYTSNIPVILAAALLANLQLMSRVGVSPGSCGLLGCLDENGTPISGVAYFLSPPRNLLSSFLALFFPQATTTFSFNEILRALIYLTYMIFACMIFSIFWINTSGMDPASVAEQIESIGMHIPGYRSDKRTIETVLERYIPALAVLGGIVVGLLAAFADFLGALGSGTGMLLTVMIIYNYYEQLRAERLEEAHPIVRKIIGE